MHIEDLGSSDNSNFFDFSDDSDFFDFSDYSDSSNFFQDIEYRDWNRKNMNYRNFADTG